MKEDFETHPYLEFAASTLLIILSCLLLQMSEMMTVTCSHFKVKFTAGRARSLLAVSGGVRAGCFLILYRQKGLFELLDCTMPRSMYSSAR